MATKILVLGAAGMAGHVIYSKLVESGEYDVFGTVNNRQFGTANLVLNIKNEDALRKIIGELKPQVVINCIGVLIKGAKDDPANAIYINAFFPHLLASICKEHHAKLIHISTDCVFSGKAGQYAETSIKDAYDLYGQSKGLGEVIDDCNLTIRTSIIGPELSSPGEGLFDWFMKQSGEVLGYTKAIWSGVTTIELANFILWVLKQDITGLVHLTNGVPISKYDLLKLIQVVFNSPVTLIPSNTLAVNKSFRATREIEYEVPLYERMLAEQLLFMKKHIPFYPNYDLGKYERE